MLAIPLVIRKKASLEKLESKRLAGLRKRNLRKNNCNRKLVASTSSSFFNPLSSFLPSYATAGHLTLDQLTSADQVFLEGELVQERLGRR